MSHLCFYSARCRYSQMFLEEIAKTPFTKEFQFVCVDAAPGRSRPALPPYVKAVPTLMIQGETAPRTDGNVMNWLSERRMSASSGRSAAVAASAGAEGPAAFIGGDSFDDGLALIGEDMGNTNRLTGSMASLNDLSAMTAPDARTIPGAIMAGAGGGGGGAPQMSAKAKAMEDALERYRSARDVDVKGVIQRR